MDQKRNIFSRFYFISDPVLLEILGQASNSHNIQPHLLSLFDNIAKLIYSETEYDKVLEIVSKEGEKIALDNPVLCVGGVENWLNFLLKESKYSVNQLIANVDNYIMTDPKFSIIMMVEKFPAQVRMPFSISKMHVFCIHLIVILSDRANWFTNAVDNSY